MPNDYLVNIVQTPSQDSGAAFVDNYAPVLGGYQQLGLGVECIWRLQNRRSLVLKLRDK
ncbi:MAG: hypothetical protein HWQ38_29090 [Nostoc sp. NMS7]|uniref:hypothetical protein n=1 Tax=Nostoc sp. TaxID=1180 RepID=UPI0035CC69AC|nr:hypothetical protein [Nostoc sp. NMS7]